MARGIGAAISVLMLALPCAVSADVFEVGDDGTVSRLDTPFVRAAPPAVRVLRVVSSARASAYRPFVEAAATRYAVSPALIDAIAHTESRYRQGATSSAGAGGIMQLMPRTARDLGVDRADAASNILGGTAYVRKLLDRYDGDVVCAVAAYNAGPGAVSKARCVPPYRETRAYVVAVLDHLSASAN